MPGGSTWADWSQPTATPPDIPVIFRTPQDSIGLGAADTQTGSPVRLADVLPVCPEPDRPGLAVLNEPAIPAAPARSTHQVQSSRPVPGCAMVPQATPRGSSPPGATALTHDATPAPAQQASSAGDGPSSESRTPTQSRRRERTTTSGSIDRRAIAARYRALLALPDEERTDEERARVRQIMVVRLLERMVADTANPVDVQRLSALI